MVKTEDPIVTVVGENGVEFPLRLSQYESYKDGLTIVAEKPKKVVRKKRVVKKAIKE